jgi:hypothetical protein
MKGLVFVLCAATALASGLLLLRNYQRTKVRLLLWCGLFFLALALENLLVFVVLILIPQVDLHLFRSSVALVGVAIFLYGLIWDTQ